VARCARLPRLLVLAVLLLLAAGVGQARAASADEGEQLFQQSCASCHTIGGGDTVGPDLAGVLDRSDREFVKQFILAPDAMIAAGDPTATALLEKYGVPMPNLGLTEDQVASLIAYLEAAGGTAGGGGSTTTTPATTTPAETTPATTTPAAVAGNAAAGHDLFTGSTQFANGGPPCMSCHTIAGLSGLGGGNVGPVADLTNAAAKYGGEAGLTGVLTTIAFPTMQPIFANQPLTPQEVADLVAFIAAAPQQGAAATSSTGKFIGLAFAVIGGLVLLSLVVWRRRLIAVRRPLVSRSTSRHS